VECYNTVFGSKRSTVCAQAVYFLHSTMPSVTCLRLSDVSIICHVTYFQFPIQVCFSSMSVRQATQQITQYQTSDVAKNLGQYLSCTRRISQPSRGNDFELILAVKWKIDIRVTIWPVTGYISTSYTITCHTVRGDYSSGHRNNSLCAIYIRLSEL